MSIRPEEAAAEASRFSLRSAILGASERMSAPAAARQLSLPKSAPATESKLNPMNSMLMQQAHLQMQNQQHAHHTHHTQHTQHTQARAAAASTPGGGVVTSGLTFGSIVGSSSPQAPHALGVNQHAAETMRKLAQLQKMSVGAPAVPAQTKKFIADPAMSHQKILTAGYVHGGSARTDTSAEIMRLTALVDSLNTKVSAQAERLQKTESSLLKANQAITNERATYNARMLRMQADLKSSKDSEMALKKHVTKLETNVAAHATSKRSFEEAAQKAEQFDEKIVSLESQLSSLTKERDALVLELSKTNASAEDKLKLLSSERDEFASQLKAEKDAAACTAAASESKMLELQKLMNTVESERDSLSQRLESEKAQTEARINEVKTQYEEALEKSQSQTANVDAIIEARNRFQAELELSTHELAEAKQALQAMRAEREANQPDLMFFEETLPTESDANATVGFSAASTDVFVAENDYSVHPSHGLSRGHPLDSKIASVAARFKSQGIDVSIARAGPAGDIHTESLTSMAMDTSAASADAKVTELVKSVSLDITSACARGRTKYLLAMDVPKEQVEKEMNELMSSTVAS